jgi:dolichyl-phosphate-mannose--protein O-mannosyl transferase
MPALDRSRDPLAWCALIALAFLALCWNRLGIPSEIYFDEIHYVVAARKLLELVRHNPEHPMVGKEIIAAAIWAWGDRPIVWRIPSALFGAAGLFAFGRLMWFTSGRHFATIAAMLLLATDFAWFIQSRIAMLDMFMAGLGMIALWQFAAALRTGGHAARSRLVLCGLCLGLAIGAKWSVAPAAMLPGLTVLFLRVREHKWRALLATNARIMPGISLAEAGLWLGTLPLAVYWATFAPLFYLHDYPIAWYKPIEQHQYMFKLQDSVRKLHPYRSVWWHWIADWRSVWYLYKVVDGSQRGIVLIGNIASMYAGIAALVWSIWAAIRRRRTDALAFVALYLASLGLWIVSEKPIQFYYHYLLPGSFLMGCLALALDELWHRKDRWRWAGPGFFGRGFFGHAPRLRRNAGLVNPRAPA